MPLIDNSEVTTETALQLMGTTKIVGGITLTVDRLSSLGNIIESHGTTVPTDGIAGFSKNSDFRKTDAPAGSTGQYTNIGTNTSCQFALVDTATPSGDTAVALVDTNAVIALDVGTTASAVNNLRVTNSATGAVAANAVTLTAVGTDAAVSLAIAPKGATGITTVGLSTGTGDIVLGSSSGAQTVKVGNGAGVSTVNLANTTVTGAVVNIASAATGAGITDTTTIAGGNAAATGIKVVNIATGVAGTSGNNRVTVGGGTTSKVTLNASVSSYQAINYIASETGANNAIAGALTDASGTNITLAAGLEVSIKLAHTLQVGANTFNLNAGGAVNIKSHLNVANNISTGYAATGVIRMIYDGTQWVDMSQ